MQIFKEKVENKNVKKRYEWLDIIKAICIISVVIFHIGYKSQISFFNQTWNYLELISDLYKVTIFYCVAGITLNNNKIKNTIDFLIHKFKKVYIKAIVIGIIALVLHNILININFYKVGYSYSGKIMDYYSVKDFALNLIYTLFLGNREVILGAFWFVYSLIICFIILTLIEFVINKIDFVKQKRECRLFITFCLMIISIFLTNYLNITIPRISNSLVGVFLLDSTNYLFENKRIANSNLYVFICCLIIVLFAPLFGKISMNKNVITSPCFLIAVVFSALYILIYISKKMEKLHFFDLFKYIGRNSFSIMAFHFIGFKLGSIILNILGFNTDIALLVPEVNNIFLLIYYLFFGIITSLLLNYTLKKCFKFNI